MSEKPQIDYCPYCKWPISERQHTSHVKECGDNRNIPKLGGVKKISVEAAVSMAALLALNDIETGDIKSAKIMLETLTGKLQIDYLRERVAKRLALLEE